MLTAIGIALYLDGSEDLRDWNQEPGAGFLVCMVLCPAPGVITLGLALYAGVRLFLRPRTLGHAFVRLALLVAHVSVLLVWTNAISSTATALVARLGQSSSRLDPTEARRAVDSRDYPDCNLTGARARRTACLLRPPLVPARRGWPSPVAGRVHDERSDKRQATGDREERESDESEATRDR